MTPLSDRQRDVARLVADDIPDKLIAEQLEISPRTVHEHLKRIGRKINAPPHRRRHAITRWVLEQGSAGFAKAVRALLPDCQMTDETFAALRKIEPTPEWKWLGLPLPPVGGTP